VNAVKTYYQPVEQRPSVTSETDDKPPESLEHHSAYDLNDDFVGGRRKQLVVSSALAVARRYTAGIPRRQLANRRKLVTVRRQLAVAGSGRRLDGAVGLRRFLGLKVAQRQRYALTCTR